MQPHRLMAGFNAHAGRGFIALTQLATRRGWVRGPSNDREVLGELDFRYRVRRDYVRAETAPPVENAHEMVFDRAGRLYLLTDHPQNNVLVFGADGEVVDTWTLGMEGAHGLSMATEGDAEFLFVCDAYGGRVVKTTLHGEVVLELPSPHALGVYGAFESYQPTQTAVAPNGDVYVADGYGSDRVLRFDAGGHYLQHFGGHGAGPADLRNAHGVAIDARRGPGLETLLVTSRVQQCIKRFSLDGEYLDTIALPGGFPCRPVVHGSNVYVGLCWSGAYLRPNTGFVVVLGSDDQVVATLGGHLEGTGSTSSLRSDYSTFTHVHDVAVDAAGDVYVCEWNAGNRYPLRLERLDARSDAGVPTGVRRGG